MKDSFWDHCTDVKGNMITEDILGDQFVLSPAMGAVLMSLSTIIVALNAQLLKRI